ncbi:MAG TPA: hypothetical protein VFX97_03510 [Pyrinomonadaceae bacterium]|nr:hypothetical protein [Pyrinomonadaceae bacterium]
MNYSRRSKSGLRFRQAFNHMRLDSLSGPSCKESIAAHVFKQARKPALQLCGLLCSTLLLLSMCACSRRQSSVLDLVPIDSCAVVIIDWATVRNDNDLKQLFKGDQFEGILQQLVLSSEEVKTAVVFSGINTQATAGLLVHGSFNRKQEIASLKGRGWQEQRVDGHPVYTNGKDYVALPQTGTVFAGSREAAAAVFRALGDSQQRFISSSPYKQIAAGMTARNSSVRAFLVIPQGSLDMADAALTATSLALSLFDLGGVGSLLKQINVARGFGLNLSRGTNQEYPAEMCVLMRDEQAAAVVTGSLNLMKRFSTLAATNNRDEQALRALQNVSVTRVKEVLSIKMTVPRAVLVPPASP